jgi:predicted PurR-regulated permease PerM
MAMALAAINRRLVLFVVVAVVALAVAWSARAALWPFIFGLSLAYLIAPLVERLHRVLPRRLRDHPAGRPVAILAVYFAFVLVVVAAAVLIVPPVSRQAADLLHRAPAYYERAQDSILRFVEANRALVPPQVVPIVQRALEGDLVTRIAGPVLRMLQRGLTSTVGAVSGTISALLGLFVVPIWLVYILKDTSRVRHGALHLVPHDIRPDVEALRIICDRVLSAYIRGQLLIAVILGTLFTVALVLLHVRYSLLLGFFAGMLAVVPFIGSFLGALVAVAVAFAQSARLALLVTLAFLGIQQIDNIFISPRVQGRSVALNPALIMVVLVAGQYLLGPIGLLAAVPLTAIIRDVVHFLYLRVGEDHPSAASALATVGYGEHVTAAVRGHDGESAVSRPV